ncbi:MAG: prepilin-type N-terminal cleavage/methylation domain-containing protein [Lachnospiraceae bacterium]|nr:prepilin-type N-terminal cleavage/methylation domain-containing protein [Lachnospiraceae bacterium]
MKKNSGFTLVEVIIAVAILAVAAAPMISNFVKSGTVNMKARRQLNEMNLAQDIMEGLSAYKGEEVIAKFESAESLNGTLLPARLKYSSHGDRVMSGGTLTDGYKVDVNTDDNTAAEDATASLGMQYADLVGSKVIPKMNKAEPDYYFYINGLKQQKNTYDVSIKMSYAGYQGKIDDELNRMYEVNDSIDCSFANVERAGGGSYYSDAMSTFATLTSPVTVINQSMLNGKIEHVLRCEVTNDGPDADHPDYQVLVTEKYKIKDTYVTSWNLNPVDSVYLPVNLSPIYDNNSEKPRNIYLTYCGTPGSSLASSLDTIELVNHTGEEINFFVFRQKRNSSDAINSSYKCELHITSDDGAGNLNDLTKVVQNLRYDLNLGSLDNLRYYDEGGHEISEENTKRLNRKKGISDTDPDITSISTHYDKNRCDIYYNTTVNKILSDDYERLIDDGLMDSTTPTIYNVEIIVKDRKTGTEVTYKGALSGGRV